MILLIVSKIALEPDGIITKEIVQISIGTLNDKWNLLLLDFPYQIGHFNHHSSFPKCKIF